MARICRGCGGVLGRDCYHESDCMSISDQMARQPVEDFGTALDFIKELCDILDDPHARNHQETIGNAVMNAMGFYQNHRPPEKKAPITYSDGSPVDDFPF